MLRAFKEIVVLVHDGVFSVETGAGMSNARFIHALVRQEYGPKLRVGAIETAQSNPDFRPAWYARVTWGGPYTGYTRYGSGFLSRMR